MKVIDLINMMNNKEELQEKMIINKRNFHSNVFRSMIYEEDCNTDIWMAIKLQHIDLDDTVKIIKDEIDIDSIEETEIKNDGMKYFEYENDGATESGYSKNYSAGDIETRIKINELVQAVKQLNKEIKSIKEK